MVEYPWTPRTRRIDRKREKSIEVDNPAGLLERVDSKDTPREKNEVVRGYVKQFDADARRATEMWVTSYSVWHDTTGKLMMEIDYTYLR